ncbi:hypothetical protein ACIBEJ_35105 [Nonomuraea sp. NPDC050790]|uniref:hypothetical protein n=1 Tax=Nonomuraea sp. NPDC050790 TaxID=3364371 RepID=UPI00379B9BF4
MADRSVSVSLRARVTDFVTGMGAAKKSTQDLSRNMTETGASADRMRQRLEAATRALPKIQIDADSTAAEIKFAELRAELEKLSSKRIGIDIDAATARTEIAEIERQLEQLQRSEVDINVRADIGSALSELRAMDGEVSRLDGRQANVRVDANVGGALANIALVAAALASLPAVSTIGVGVAGLGAAFTAAGVGAAAFTAAAAPGFTRVTEALRASEAAAKSAGAATGGAGQSAAQAAQQALQLEAAEKRLADAKKEARSAEEDLTRAREAGRRALEDMNFSLDRSVLSQKDAALAVREAAARLAELRADPKATQLEIERAQLAHEMAMQRLEEQSVKTQRQKKDTADANKAGVEGTREYQRGLERVSQAQEKVADAQRQLTMLQLQQNAAMSGGGGGATKLKDAFADLSKAEKALAKDLKAFLDTYQAWQESVQPQTFAVISGGLDLISSQLPRLSPMVTATASSFLVLERDAQRALAGPFWAQFLSNITQQIPSAIVGLGRSFGNVTTGVAGMINAFLPFTPVIVGGIEKATAAFSQWGQQLASSNEFRQFILFVQENAPQVWELIKNVAGAIGNLVTSLAPLGVGPLAGLNLLASIVKDMDPAHIQMIAIAIGAVYAAVKVGQVVNVAATALSNLQTRMDAVGTTATGVKGKLAGVASVLGAGGPWGIAIAAGVTAVGLFAQRQAEADSRIRELTATLDKQTGAITADTREWTRNRLETEGVLKAAQQLGIPLRTVTEAALGNKAALEEVNAALGRFTDKAQGAKVIGGSWSGMADENVRSANLLKDALNTTNTELGESVASHHRLAEASGESTQATTTASSGMQAMGSQAAAARGQVATLKGELDALTSANFNAEQANIAFASALSRAKDAAKENGAATNTNTQAYWNNRSALVDVARASNEVRTALEQQGVPMELVNEKARQQRDAFIAVAEKMGYTKTQAKAMADQMGLIPSKVETKVDAPGMPKTKQDFIDLAKEMGIGKERAEELWAKLKKLDGMQVKATFTIREILESTSSGRAGLKKQERQARSGGIFTYGGGRLTEAFAAGGIEKYAAGGVRPGPHVANQPTVLFGEGNGPEAFIPYETRFRSRAIELLGQVASDFGLELYSQQAAKRVDSVGGVVKEAQTALTSGLGSATSMLSMTLGDAGSLTGSIDQVSQVGEAMSLRWVEGSQVLAASVAGMSELVGSSIDFLSASVDVLGAVVAQAASAAGAKTSSTNSSKAKAKAKPGGLVEGHGPESGFAMALGGVQSLAYQPVNTSRVSAPQQVPYRPQAAGPAPESGSGSSGGASGGRSGALVHVENQYVTSPADVEAGAVYLYARLGSKGP